MKIDIRIIVTVVYFVVNIVSYKNDKDGMYLPDFSWVFTFLISTICYLVFWILWLML